MSQTGEEADRQRAKALQLTCIAGLGGLPQVTVPLLSPAGYPVGLSFIAGRHKDLRLLHWLLSKLPMLKGGLIQ
ncbi:amidase [compost metagenome]